MDITAYSTWNRPADPTALVKEGGVFTGESTTEDADVQGSFNGNLVVRGRLLVRREIEERDHNEIVELQRRLEETQR